MSDDDNITLDDQLKTVNSNDDTYLGPNYEYYRKIKNPEELGILPDGSIIRNIKGVVSYAEVLMSGDSEATNHGLNAPLGGPGGVIRMGPLGSKFFIKTGSTCVNEQGEEVDRSAYINTVPDGKLPLLNLLGIELKSFKGLVPGILGNMVHMNPLKLFNAFSNSKECIPVTMPTVDENDVRSNETRFLLKSDIEDLDPCWFPCDKNGNRTNIITKKGCSTNCEMDTEYKIQRWGDEDINKIYREGFKNIIDKSEMPDNLIMQMYFFSLTCLIIYIIYKMCKK